MSPVPAPPTERRPLCWAEVDLGRLAANVRAIRRLQSPPPRLLAVVKADAYGHGMKPVARTLWREGVRAFGVASSEEALSLRRLLPRAQILLLGALHPGRVRALLSAGVVPSVSCAEDASLLEHALAGRRSRYPVHLKIDTGMGRLGIWHAEAEGLVRHLASCRRLEVRGLYTHFSSADDDGPLTRLQLERFRRVVRLARSAGLEPDCLHAANSIGMIRFRRARLDLVRPGIVLYGINPVAPRPIGLDVRPLLSWRTRICFLKRVEKGRTLSYGAAYRAPKTTTVAVLPVGYGHGYRISLSNRAEVLVGGRRCRVVGRVTMDHTLVDVGGVPGVRRWDEVTLIGRQGRERVGAEELARHAGTIPYEILCGIHPKVPRFYS